MNNTFVVTEALWKGKPVVASNVDGLPRQVIDNQTGFLVEPNDIEGCADIVGPILKHPHIGRALGANGKEHARRNFLMSRHVLDHLRLLNKILQEYFNSDES